MIFCLIGVYELIYQLLVLLRGKPIIPEIKMRGGAEGSDGAILTTKSRVLVIVFVILMITIAIHSVKDV